MFWRIVAAWETLLAETKPILCHWHHRGIEALVRLVNSERTADLNDGERVTNAAEALVNATRNDSHKMSVFERVVFGHSALCTSKTYCTKKFCSRPREYCSERSESE